MTPSAPSPVSAGIGPMTIADLDIWRAANLLIQRHGGPDAAIVAAQRADECLASGDAEGQHVWLKSGAILPIAVQRGVAKVTFDPDQSSDPMEYRYANRNG